MNVSKIMTTTTNAIKHPVNTITNAKCLKGFYKNYRSNNAKYIAGIGILSIALKDGLGCYMYVKQSLNNKKIPEDKRKFVAALDLANGGLMILTQVVTFFTISNKKVQDAIFNKFFGKFFGRASRKGHTYRIKEMEKYKNIKDINLYTSFEALRKNSATTFGVLTSLVAATILAKRILVPFIATPLAEKAKKFLYGKDDKSKAKTEPKKTESKAEAVTNDEANKIEAKIIVESKSNKPEETNLIENFKSRNS